jgi:hypothetical protein
MGFFRKEPTMVESYSRKEPTMVEKLKRRITMKKIFKKGVISEYLPWIIIALVLLVVVIISIFVLKENGVSLIDKIKNLFRRG